jgi:uncharacterized protein (DUF2249 family)/iron-sulfur cluster repair protein YtfE (RIC family)
MEDVVIAFSDADAVAAAAVEQHHAQMAGTLGQLVEQLVVAVSRHDADSATSAQAALVEWCENDLVPHALAEERAMYPAALSKPEARLLIEGMLAEHLVIAGLVSELATASDLVRAAAAAKALQVMFDSHLGKENDLVLPLLVSARDVSVAELLGGMHELLGAETHGDHDHEDRHTGAAGCGAHTCTCGDVDSPGYPELDARVVPHAIRHATVLGALDAVRAGGGMVLIAPHDPLPLLAQIEQRFPNDFTLDYLERGPEAWRIAFIRRALV